MGVPKLGDVGNEDDDLDVNNPGRMTVLWGSGGVAGVCRTLREPSIGESTEAGIGNSKSPTLD
jgi:hypothetical protein